MLKETSVIPPLDRHHSGPVAFGAINQSTLLTSTLQLTACCLPLGCLHVHHVAYSVRPKLFKPLRLPH